MQITSYFTKKLLKYLMHDEVIITTKNSFCVTLNICFNFIINVHIHS